MSDQTKTDAAIKLQAFVRGCMCRDRVAKMVQQWIDDLIAQRTGKEESKEYSENEGSFSSLGLLEIEPSNIKNDIAESSLKSCSHTEGTDPAQGSVSSLLSKFEVKRETTDRTSNKSSQISTTNKQGSLSMNGSFSMNGSISTNGSVSNILSKFESKRDMKSPVPTRNWTPPKAQKEKAVANQPPLPLTDTPAPSTPKKTFKEPHFVSNATKHVPSSDELLHEQEIRLNEEIEHLLIDIKRIGEAGKPYVNFGELFDDDDVANYYEALVGTLKAAKKKKLINYDGQILLKGVSDKVVVKIL